VRSCPRATAAARRGDHRRRRVSSAPHPGGDGPDFLRRQGESHEVGQPFAGEAVVAALSDPDLGDELNVHGGQGRMEGPGVQSPIHGSGEEDEGRPPNGRHLETKGRKGGLATPGNVVQVYQDGDGALATIGSESPAILLFQVEGVVVLQTMMEGKNKQISRRRTVSVVRQTRLQPPPPGA
jgi:hypothetical protein